MHELTLEMITGIHDRILANDGGDCRIISEGNLHQLVFRANLTEDRLARAATVLWLLCAFPAFREGNRRTAWRLAEMISASEGDQVDASCEEVGVLIRGIDAFTVEIEDVEQFLLRHARRS